MAFYWKTYSIILYWKHFLLLRFCTGNILFFHDIPLPGKPHSSRYIVGKQYFHDAGNQVHLFLYHGYPHPLLLGVIFHLLTKSDMFSTATPEKKREKN